MASQREGLWKGTKRSNKVIDMIFFYASSITRESLKPHLVKSVPK